MLLAYQRARKGKRDRASVQRFELERESNLIRLCDQLRDGSYAPGKHRTFLIREPKSRVIAAAPFDDRVAQHTLCNLVQPFLQQSFIADTFRMPTTHASVVAAGAASSSQDTACARRSASMIRTIQIEGFKSIASQTLELGRVNCFIGANGVGKSNLLEAIGVLGAAASGRVDDESIIRRGVRAGVPGLYKASFEVGRIRPHITLGATGDVKEELRVSLLNPLDKPEPAWSYKTETLSDGTSEIVSRGVRSDKGNLADTAGLSALKVVELASDNPAARLVHTLQTYAIYCPNTPTLRGAVPDIQTRDPVGLSGGRLAEAFDDLREALEEGDRLDSVFGLVDWVSDIRMTDASAALLSPSVPRSKNVLKFTDRYMKASRNPLTAHDASEGALYVLFCAILCLSPNAPQLFAVDNLDQALNPRLITRLTQRLSGWLMATDSERQLLFTAHNPAVLDGLDLTDNDVRLFAVERNSSGHTCVGRVTITGKLLALNEQYPLSRLWLMGHLGAVPNV